MSKSDVQVERCILELKKNGEIKMGIFKEI